MDIGKIIYMSENYKRRHTKNYVIKPKKFLEGNP